MIYCKKYSRCRWSGLLAFPAAECKQKSFLFTGSKLQKKLVVFEIFFQFSFVILWIYLALFFKKKYPADKKKTL